MGITIVAAQQQEDPPVTLNAVEVDGLGPVLTDQDGMTLYRFNRDTADPSASNCDSDCTAAWPPVLGNAENVVVAGLDRQPRRVDHPVDGDSQITVAGWPLYRFVKDKKPGDVRGQGVGDAWYTLTPEGKRAGEVPVKLVGKQLPTFGAALTDQDGFTLYLFTKDSKNPSVPTCYDECAKVCAAGAGRGRRAAAQPGSTQAIDRRGRPQRRHPRAHRRRVARLPLQQGFRARPDRRTRCRRHLVRHRAGRLQVPRAGPGAGT